MRVQGANVLLLDVYKRQDQARHRHHGQHDQRQKQADAALGFFKKVDHAVITPTSPVHP